MHNGLWKKEAFGSPKIKKKDNNKRQLGGGKENQLKQEATIGPPLWWEGQAENQHLLGGNGGRVSYITKNIPSFVTFAVQSIKNWVKVLFFLPQPQIQQQMPKVLKVAWGRAGPAGWPYTKHVMVVIMMMGKRMLIIKNKLMMVMIEKMLKLMPIMIILIVAKILSFFFCLRLSGYPLRPQQTMKLP